MLQRLSSTYSGLILSVDDKKLYFDDFSREKAVALATKELPVGRTIDIRVVADEASGLLVPHILLFNDILQHLILYVISLSSFEYIEVRKWCCASTPVRGFITDGPGIVVLTESSFLSQDDDNLAFFLSVGSTMQEIASFC